MSQPSTRAGTPKPLEGSTLFAADDPLYDANTDIEAQAIRANLHSSHDSGSESGSARRSGSGSYRIPSGSSGSLPSGSPPSYRDSTSTVQWLRSKLPGGHVPTGARYLEEGEQGFEMNTLGRGAAVAQPSAPPLSVVDKMLALAANAATEEERIAAMNCIPRIVAEQEKAALEREQVANREQQQRDVAKEEIRKEKQARWDENVKVIGPFIGIPIVAVGGVCGLLFLLWLVVQGLKFIFS